MDTLTEIQERHGAVRDVESKLLELQQIFMDIAVLVESQGDMLDNIESQVLSVVDHVQSGAAALQKERKLERNSRKWIIFKAPVEQLRKRFIHSIAPRGLAGDRRYVVPASGFSFSAQQIC
ncbi:hypothetical protein C5167_006447 [Papaver somniferum]|uniref:t-SNARE coiled-coil homology domain-containing protein n=1 Tax=Papaver somniferum TaxID=3469 RepID=A0A4Y7JGJ2_PAPSO|nr:hypothetical protein C5167_006447 [Papaver somniferum]